MLRRLFMPDHLPFLVMATCLILGLAFPTLGLWLGGAWGTFLVVALGFTWWINRHSLNTGVVKAGLMIVSLVMAGTTGVSTIRWWLPLLGDILRVRS